MEEHFENDPAAVPDPTAVQAAVDAVTTMHDQLAPPQAAPDDSYVGVAMPIVKDADDDDVHLAPATPMPSLPTPFKTPPPSFTPSSAGRTLSSKQERMDSIWLKHYKELEEYKAQNNHVRVPRKSGPLGEWVRTQRRYYKLWRRGESVPLNKERMEMLDQLGFIWLPAEEKVGGGFRGGRPKKRKREDEEVVMNAVAAAAVVAGSNGGVTPSSVVGPNGIIYNFASPSAVGEDGTLDGLPVDGTATGVDENGATLATAAAAASAATPTHITSIPYTFHQDPFYLHSLSKRQDISNQLSLLEKHESINRPAPSANQPGGLGQKESFKTQKLTDVHEHYEDVVYVVKRSNEELRDAELALDRAKKTFAQAQELKDKADTLLASASEDVLKAELEDGDNEWIAMYKCLVNYKEKNGNVLFPRANGGKRNKTDQGEDEGKVEEGDNQEENTPDRSGVSYGTMRGALLGTGEETRNAGKTVIKTDAGDVVVDDKAMEVDETASDIAEEKDEQMVAPTPDEFGSINITEALLQDWVGKMRKYPKKQFKKWRRYALDKLGFVWHQYNATWTDRYQELVQFREKNGHTVVPTTNSNLGIWVGTQRKQYRLMQQGKPTHMTAERVQLLDEIGFVWHVNTWNERYEELKAFHSQFGHFLVPTDFENRQLRPWITTQRSHFRFLQEGKPSQLTQERIDLLDKIGFPWKTREDWQTRYQELVQFIDENGNCAVPRNYNRFPKLYRWVNCQRMEYQKYTEGSASRLKADQISLLENIGFE